MTDKTPAMPELTPLTGDILLEDRTIYVLNKNGENVWWASVQPGFHDNGIRVSDDQCRAVAADLVRLAALQSAQPAALSDGPTDEQIAAGMRELFAGPKPWPSWEATLKRVYQAMYALRPQADTLCFELSAMLGCPPSDADVVAAVSSLLTPRPQAVPMTTDFNRDDMLDVANSLDADYPKTINVGEAIEPGHDVHIESSTGCAARFIRAALNAKATQQAMTAFLQPADMQWLQRFKETTEDDESYDVPKDALKRLAELGVVRPEGFGRYSITAFGKHVTDPGCQFAQFPLMTHADHEAAYRTSSAHHRITQRADGGDSSATDWTLQTR